jgi:hypothetical protein
MGFLFLRRRPRTIYGCGNCRETFKTEKALLEHMTPVCPLVAIERQIRAWNERMLDECSGA